MVSGSGDVHYEGINFVETKGQANDRLSGQQLIDLIAAINECNFFALRESYQGDIDGCPEVWSDMPSVIISINVEGKTKRIQHYLGCFERSPDHTEPGVPHPLKLYNLENRVDEIVGTKRWIKDTSGPAKVGTVP